MTDAASMRDARAPGRWHGRHGGQAATMLPVVVSLAMFCLGVFVFAPTQSVWVDEATQLSGSGLPWVTLFRWLAGSTTLPLGVPPDRMPPLSYVLDGIGWRLWGPHELALRWYHAAIAGVGIAALVRAVAQRWGAGPAVVAGLILALAPKVVTIAVELRAYPIFLAIACLQTAMIVRGDIAEQPRRLALFLLLGIGGAYTHFFGVVSASAFFLAVACSVTDLPAFRRVTAAYVVLIGSCLGLIPFVTGARAISDDAVAVSLTLAELVSFPVKLIGNPELLVLPTMAMLYLGGFATALAIVVLDVGQAARRVGLAFRRDPRFILALGLGAGIITCLGASVVLHGFNPLNPRYGIWTFPPLAVLAAVALVPGTASRSAIPAPVRAIALGLLASGALWSNVFLLRHPELYTHGPNRNLEAILATAPGSTAVVHVGPGWAWGYFPLRWRHGEALPQWLLDPSGQRVVRIGSGGDSSGPALPLARLAGYRSVVFARIEPHDYQGLRTQLAAHDIALRASTALAGFPPPLAGHLSAAESFHPGAYALAARLDVAPREAVAKAQAGSTAGR